MPQPCTICTHPDRPAIDSLIVAGEPNRRIAAQCGVSEASIRRHRVAHLPKELVKAQAAQEVAQADNLLDKVREWRDKNAGMWDKLEKMLLEAEAQGNPNLMLEVLKVLPRIGREVREYQRFVGELTGALNGMEGGARQVIIVLPAKREAGSPCPTTMAVELPPEYLALDAEFEDIPRAALPPGPSKGEPERNPE